jgi:hypothetical protein
MDQTILQQWTSGELCGRDCPHFKAAPARCEHPNAPARLRLVYPMSWIDKAAPERSPYCLTIVKPLVVEVFAIGESNYVSPFDTCITVPHPEPVA